METLIIRLDKSVSKSKVKEVLKLVKGIESISEKLTRADYELLANKILLREMKKADKGALMDYAEGKKAFGAIKKNLVK
ncbi:MAG: hypothetical protein LC658_13615 [Bacteroidales bacterium]|jgi:hypothetical protein|nr:hypothetical protein [Bacteroidales bacterium]